MRTEHTPQEMNVDPRSSLCMVHVVVECNLSNQDTLGTEESVLISEVS